EVKPAKAGKKRQVKPEEDEEAGQPAPKKGKRKSQQRSFLGRYGLVLGIGGVALAVAAGAVVYLLLPENPKPQPNRAGTPGAEVQAVSVAIRTAVIAREGMDKLKCIITYKFTQGQPVPGTTYLFEAKFVEGTLQETLAEIDGQD